VATPHLVIDIETVLDPELPIAEAIEAERLPAPPHHRVIAIGALWFDPAAGVRRLGIVGDGQDERGMLGEFVKLVTERRPCLVTYNGRGFDLPVIATRCLRHGIQFRHYYAARDVRYRFSAEGHLDLMDYVADFGAAKPSKLDIIAKLCGMPGKVGVDGKDVGPLVHAGKLTEVKHYCLCDVVQTAAVFLRVQLVRGELTVAAYREAMQALLDLVKSDPRVSPVASGMNEARLLLTEDGAEAAPD
jgi:3'-5' exonuclease